MPGPTQSQVSFDATATALLDAFADTLVPPGDGFPAPSEARIVADYMTRYVVADDGAEVGYLPGVSEADVAELGRLLGEGFAAASAGDREAAVAELERDRPELFGALRLLVYAGYYSRPQVRAAIADGLEAGRDFRGTPQPYGYADVIEPWDESLLSELGGFLATDEVKPVDREALARLAESSEPARGE